MFGFACELDNPIHVSFEIEVVHTYVCGHTAECEVMTTSVRSLIFVYQNTRRHNTDKGVFKRSNIYKVENY